MFRPASSRRRPTALFLGTSDRLVGKPVTSLEPKTAISVPTLMRDIAHRFADRAVSMPGVAEPC